MVRRVETQVRTLQMCHHRLFQQRERRDFNVSISNNAIPWVQNLKVLGITFSHNLSFKNHFHQTGAKALKRMNYLKALGGNFWGASRSQVTNLTNTCIRSILDYGSQVTSFASKTDFNQLEIISNHIARFSTGLLNGPQSQSSTPKPAYPQRKNGSNHRPFLSYLNKSP